MPVFAAHCSRKHASGFLVVFLRFPSIVIVLGLGEHHPSPPAHCSSPTMSLSSFFSLLLCSVFLSSTPACFSVAVMCPDQTLFLRSLVRLFSYSLLVSCVSHFTQSPCRLLPARYLHHWINQSHHSANMCRFRMHPLRLLLELHM